MAILTSTQQRNAVSEGAALGLLLHGRDRLPHDKIAIDLAIAHAWRRWPRADQYPALARTFEQYNGTYALLRADERKHTWALYWDTSGSEAVIRRRASFLGDDPLPFEEMADVIDDRISADDWATLAGDFLGRFNR